jgi:hypothetical protein
MSLRQSRQSYHQDKNKNKNKNKTKVKRTIGVAQVVEHLSSKYTALCSLPSTTKQKTKENKKPSGTATLRDARVGLAQWCVPVIPATESHR